MDKITLEHDALLTICTGSSRKTKVWKQKQISWSDFLKRLSETKRTNETQAQYFKLGKDRQDEIKDVGGFVGGELENGRRTALTVINRQLVTLDADFAEQNLWDKAEKIFDNAACVYSTHKHTKEKPRLRLIIPLDRPVTPDEYQAISRKVAEKFGIDNFDDTTYQPHRLMYFPSTSADAEYFFKFQDGEFLSADKILTEYDDWQDINSWARSSRSKENLHNDLKKQSTADPFTKPGFIGAFCRCYTISEAIAEFLPDVYEECGKDRYTFKGGSTTGGAVVFENKFLYSFHATDPCSLKLCNAFDLVRIHKFGELDEGAENISVNKLPSYKKMNDLCNKDKKIKILLTAEALEDFETTDEDEKADMEWAAKLQRNEKTGAILQTMRNVRLILENDSRIKNSFGLDIFSQKITLLKPLKWRNKEIKDKYWTDADDAALRYFLSTNYNITNRGIITDEIINVANNNAFHSVRDYLRGLKWDGTERMEKLFVNYLGAENSEYVRVVTRKSLIAAVARIMIPGIKFDNMIVLEGDQGIGKSKVILQLGKNWFNDSITDLNNKDAYDALRGKWIILLDELRAMTRSDDDTVKKFISKEMDSFRVSYGKYTQDFPRQCIFFGTTNKKIFLRDPTGNRRFFPVHCEKAKRTRNIFEEIEAGTISEEMDQVWAEAYSAWQSGESLWVGEKMEEIAKIYQAQHTEQNPLTGQIEEFLNKKIPADWYSRDVQRRLEYMWGIGDFDEEETTSKAREKICVAEIWCEMLKGDMRNLNSHRVNNIYNALLALEGWQPYKNNREKLEFGTGYRLQKAFV